MSSLRPISIRTPAWRCLKVLKIPCRENLLYQCMPLVPLFFLEYPMDLGQLYAPQTTILEGWTKMGWWFKIDFSMVRGPNLVLTPLKSASKIHISSFVHRSKIFVWFEHKFNTEFPTTVRNAFSVFQNLCLGGKRGRVRRMPLVPIFRQSPFRRIRQKCHWTNRSQWRLSKTGWLVACIWRICW